MTIVLSIIAFVVVGYLVFLIPFSEAPELVFAIIAGLLAVVIVIGAVLIKKFSFICEQFAAGNASKKSGKSADDDSNQDNSN